MRGPLLEVLVLVVSAAIAFFAGKSTARHKADALPKPVPATVAVEKGSTAPVGAGKVPDSTPTKPPAGAGAEAAPLEKAEPAATPRELLLARALNQDVIKELKLTPDELQRIFELNRDWRARMSALVQKNLVDLSAGSATVTLGQFAIRAFPEEGAAALKEFKQSLSALLGEERGKMLADSMRGPHDFAECGQNSVMIVVKDPPPEWIGHKEFGVYQEYSVDRRHGTGGGGESIVELNDRYGLKLQFGEIAK